MTTRRARIFLHNGLGRSPTARNTSKAGQPEARSRPGEPWHVPAGPAGVASIRHAAIDGGEGDVTPGRSLPQSRVSWRASSDLIPPLQAAGAEFLCSRVELFSSAAAGHGRRHDHQTTVDHALMRGLVTAGPVMRRGASSV